MDGSLRDRDVGRSAHGVQGTIQVSRDGSIDSRSDPPRSAEAAAALCAYVIGRWARLPARLAVHLRRTHPNGVNSLVADDGIPLAREPSRSKESRLDFPIAVNGTLMRGLELNPRMLAVGGRFDREATTRPQYRLWSIDDRHPAMIRVREGGVAVAVEVWRVPEAGFAQLLIGEPPGPLHRQGSASPTARRPWACSASRRSAKASARSRATAAGAPTSRPGRQAAEKGPSASLARIRAFLSSLLALAVC